MVKPRGKGGPRRGAPPPPPQSLLRRQLELEAFQSLDRIRTFLEELAPEDRAAVFTLSVDELRKEARRLSEEEAREARRGGGGAGGEGGGEKGDKERGGYTALVDRVLGLHVSRGSWKVWAWPGGNEEFSDRASFLAWYRRAKAEPEELVPRLLSSPPGAEAGGAGGGEGEARLREIVLQLSSDLRKCSDEIDSLETPGLTPGAGGGGGGPPAVLRARLGPSNQAVVKYRQLCLGAIWQLMRGLLQAPEAFFLWFVGPIEKYVQGILPASPPDPSLPPPAPPGGGKGELDPAAPYRISFADLGKLTLMELYALFAWLEQRAESLRERLGDAGEGGGGAASTSAPVEVLEFSDDGRTVGLSRPWLDLLQAAAEGPDGRMVEASGTDQVQDEGAGGGGGVGGRGLGVLMDFLSGSVVHTAERIRESAHLPLGPYAPSVEETAAIITEGLIRAGQVWEGAEGAAEVEAKLSAVIGGEMGGEKQIESGKEKKKEAPSLLPSSPPGPAELSRLIERELVLASARVHVLGGELKDLESRVRSLRLEVSYEENVAQGSGAEGGSSKGGKGGGRGAGAAPGDAGAKLQAARESLEVAEQTVRRKEELRSELFAQQGRMLRRISEAISGGGSGGEEGGEGGTVARLVGVAPTPQEQAAATLRQLSAYVRRQRASLTLHVAALRQLELHLSDLACTDYGSMLGSRVVLPLLMTKISILAEDHFERAAERRAAELLSLEEGAKRPGGVGASKKKKKKGKGGGGGGGAGGAGEADVAAAGGGEKEGEADIGPGTETEKGPGVAAEEEGGKGAPQSETEAPAAPAPALPLPLDSDSGSSSAPSESDGGSGTEAEGEGDEPGRSSDDEEAARPARDALTDLAAAGEGPPSSSGGEASDEWREVSVPKRGAKGAAAGTPGPAPSSAAGAATAAARGAASGPRPQGPDSAPSAAVPGGSAGAAASGPAAPVGPGGRPSKGRPRGGPEKEKAERGDKAPPLRGGQRGAAANQTSIKGAAQGQISAGPGLSGLAYSAAAADRNGGLGGWARDRERKAAAAAAPSASPSSSSPALLMSDRNNAVVRHDAQDRPATHAPQIPTAVQQAWGTTGAGGAPQASLGLDSLHAISLLSELSAIALSLGVDLSQLLGSPLLSGAGLEGLLRVSPAQVSVALQTLSSEIAGHHGAIQAAAQQVQQDTARLQLSAAQLQASMASVHTSMAYIQAVLAVQRAQGPITGGAMWGGAGGGGGGGGAAVAVAGAGPGDAGGGGGFAAAPSPSAAPPTVRRVCAACGTGGRCAGFVHADGRAHLGYCGGCAARLRAEGERGGERVCPLCGEEYVAFVGKVE